MAGERSRNSQNAGKPANVPSVEEVVVPTDANHIEETAEVDSVAAKIVRISYNENQTTSKQIDRASGLVVERPTTNVVISITLDANVPAVVYTRNSAGVPIAVLGESKTIRMSVRQFNRLMADADYRIGPWIDKKRSENVYNGAVLNRMFTGCGLAIKPEFHKQGETWVNEAGIATPYPADTYTYEFADFSATPECSAHLDKAFAALDAMLD